MRRNIGTLFIILWIFLFFSACSKTVEPYNNGNEDKNKETPTPDDPDDPNGFGWEEIDINHYLLTFVKAKGFIATAYPGNIIVISYQHGDYFCSYEDEINAATNSEKAASYVALCEKYGDNGYQKIRKYYPIYTGGYDFLFHNIVSISISSITDYDTSHPAGSPLDDICELVACTPREYITSGYADSYDWSVVPEFVSANYIQNYTDGLLPFRKPLADCTPEDMVLMGDGTSNVFMLRLTKKPDTGNKLQRFIITLSDEQGETYSAETNICEWN